MANLKQLLLPNPQMSRPFLQISANGRGGVSVLAGSTSEGVHSSPFFRKQSTTKRSSFAPSVTSPFNLFQGLLHVSSRDVHLDLAPASRTHGTKHCRCCDSVGAPDVEGLSTSRNDHTSSWLQQSNQAASQVFESQVESSEESLDAAHMQPSSQQVELENKGLLEQMREIIMFAGPALGIWLSGPIMSLIDTAVVGNSSSLELAALGPGTVFCDQVGYLFMFLAVATSNLIATSIARQERDEAAHHLSSLLFIGLVCGIGLLILTGAFCTKIMKGFVGPQNELLLPAACSYVQIRGLAWPIVMVGLVAQSASLGMQDAWGPLKALAIASLLNFSGDMVLCTVLGYGIAGAAWATTVSQWVGGYFMLRSLSAKGYNPLALRIPLLEDLGLILKLAAPVLLTIFSKVFFYSLVTHTITTLGAVTLAAHQVIVGLFLMCSVAAEPLSQTAQAFMPALIQGSRRNVKKAQVLLRSLMAIGTFSGLLLGAMGICFPWFIPQVFTNDPAIISQMRTITLPFYWSVLATAPLLSLEGTLLASRDLRFLSSSMVACFFIGSSLLMVLKQMKTGFQGVWWAVAFFQTIRFTAALTRLTSRSSIMRGSQKDEPATLQSKSI